jgi:hypothetical protein
MMHWDGIPQYVVSQTAASYTAYGLDAEFFCSRVPTRGNAALMYYRFGIANIMVQKHHMYDS